MIVSWPQGMNAKVPRGSKNEAVTELRDIAPTIIGFTLPNRLDLVESVSEAAGGKAPSYLEADI